MSLEHSPAKATGAIVQGGGPAEGDLTYWNALIDEKAAADFLGMTDRFMQHRRLRVALDGKDVKKLKAAKLLFEETKRGITTSSYADLDAEIPF